MKKLGMVVFALAVVSFGVFSCQKTLDQSMNRDDVSAKVDVPAECSGPYAITLESVTATDQGYMWVWKVVNPNPGNGSNGTVQGLSHFNALLPDCAAEGLPLTVLSSGYSGDGNSWIPGPTTPSVDPSIPNTCDATLNAPSLKFNMTEGWTVLYFRIEIAENYKAGVMNGYYKSGQNTGCGITCFEGISCEPREEGCSFSQGFWFAKPIGMANAWPENFMMGGKAYTQAEGRAIFFVSGNIELKRAFTQAATIRLSIAKGVLTVENASSIMGAVTGIEGVLNGLPKLTAANVASLNSGLPAAQRRNLSNWAGAIGSYVDANHCELNPGY